jgi:predicted lipoprotein with Yx(FWY)xxD motif
MTMPNISFITPKTAHLMKLAGCLLAVSGALASCGDQEGKLQPTASAGPSGAPALGDAGEGGLGGSAAAPPREEPELVSGGGGSPPASGDGGALATGGQPTRPPTTEDCVYALDGAAGAGDLGGSGGGGHEGGAAGQGGATAELTVAKGTSRLIGDYLTDADGRALYVFGADLAGDCRSLPVSACTDDCLLSWPLFHAARLELAAGLDAAAFGSITRADGAPQTTYYGWPLYYYENDAAPGDVTGHGVGVWGLARVILPNVVVRRVGMDRLLADGAGRTLYAFADDTKGTAETRPVSACVGECLDAHPSFSPSYLGPISILEPRDFSSFVRSDGEAQVAYKGAPLYYSLLDDRPGAINGTGDAGFTIVLR